MMCDSFMHCARMFDSSLRADAGICPLPNRVHTYVFAETVTSEGDLVDVVRGYGVRRENVRLNTQRRLYAFNMVQRMALPEAYHPPEGSAAGGKG